VQFYRFILFVTFSLCCSGVLFSQTPQDAEIMNGALNVSVYSSNVYIGISGRMSTPEKEIEYGKLHIAHQMAIREKCIVDKGMVYVEGRYDDFIAMDSNFDYDDSYIDELMDYIEILRVNRFSEMTIIIAKDKRLPAIANIAVRSGDVRPQWVRSPRWVRNLPGMEQYYIGVGTADRYSAHYKGFRVSDVRAAQEIAEQKNTFLRTYLFDKVDDSIGQTITDIGDISLTKATLEGFYILDRWVEPDGSAYYSLGIANKIEVE
jgi:hypothetical protein